MKLKINNNVKTFFNKTGNATLSMAGRLGNQKHMTVIRDAFAVLFPLAISVGLAVLISTFVFGSATPQTSILGWIGYATGDTVQSAPNDFGQTTTIFKANSPMAALSTIGSSIFSAVVSAYTAIVSLYLAFTIGYLLAQARGVQHPLLNGVVAVAAFVVTTNGRVDLFGAGGMLTSIVIAMLASDLLTYLGKKERLMIKLPDGVPPAVARSFAKFLPSTIVIFGAILLNVPFMLFAYYTKTIPPRASLYDGYAAPLNFSFAHAVLAGVQSPFVEFASGAETGLGFAIIYLLGISILWFFGLHGPNILGSVFTPIYSIIGNNNVTGVRYSIISGATFDAFIFFGGSGATLALVVALLIFARKKTPEQTVARLSIGPGIFNINEPVIYGLPIVLNVKWLVPFVLAPIVMIVFVYLGYTWTGINIIRVSVPWTVPPIISALLATSFDWKAGVLAAINLGVAFLIYLPFVLLWTRKIVANGKLDAASTSEVVEAAETSAAVEAPASENTAPKARRARAK